MSVKPDFVGPADHLMYMEVSGLSAVIRGKKNQAVGFQYVQYLVLMGDKPPPEKPASGVLPSAHAEHMYTQLGVHVYGGGWPELSKLFLLQNY